MRSIRVAEPASAEFQEAVRWYESRRTGLGGEFFDAVAATLSLVQVNPDIGPMISGDGLTRRALVSRFPYQVVYRLRPTELVVVVWPSPI